MIESEEKEMINNVFDLGDSVARDIMVPRIDMSFVDVEASYEELMEIFRRDHYTRLPVYEDNTDNVIGIINMKDLILLEDRAAFPSATTCASPCLPLSQRNSPTHDRDAKDIK